MRSNAPASPSWARRMASASVISLDSVGLVRVTVPVGTHPLNGMHPWLLKLHLCEYPVLVMYRSRLPRATPAAQPSSELDNCSQPYFLWKLYVRLGLTVRMAGTCITSLRRNASSSSAGKAQKNDFNTTVVSPMHVFRSYPSTSSSLQARSGYNSAPSETSSTIARVSFCNSSIISLSACNL